MICMRLAGEREPTRLVIGLTYDDLATLHKGELLDVADTPAHQVLPDRLHHISLCCEPTNDALVRSMQQLVAAVGLPPSAVTIGRAVAALVIACELCELLV